MQRKSLRRIKVKTPGGKIIIRYRKRNPSPLKSSDSKEHLHGVKRLIQSKFAKLPKTKKRPQRPFGGVLSSKAARLKIKELHPIISAPLDIGQVCIKTAGKEAGKMCVIVDTQKDSFVLIDGQVKRKRCNIMHLEAIDKKIKIKPKTSTEIIKKELEVIGIKTKEKRSKQIKEKPIKKRKTKEIKEKKPKKAAKK